jgi:CBS domain-containing protein
VKTYQLMTREVISVPPDTPVWKMMQLFERHRVNNLPVVDDEARVIGLVNQFYLTAYADLLGDNCFTQLTAADVMERQVICIDENDEISDVAWIIAHHGVDMLPVLRDGRMVGVISRTDLIRLYAPAG